MRYMEKNIKLNDISEIERKILSIFPRVLAIDEVNVCSYFGEIVIAGVILPKKALTWVCDSKLLKEHQLKQRVEALRGVEYFIEYVSPKECDQHMLKGEYDAIKRMCKKARPDFVFIDYHSIPDKFHIPQWGYKGADRHLWGVAAASIIAKYTWNNMCYKYHKKFPEYNLIHNKGSFGNQLFDLTTQYGLTKHHRKKWISSTCIKKGINFDSIPLRDKYIIYSERDDN